MYMDLLVLVRYPDVNFEISSLLNTLEGKHKQLNRRTVLDKHNTEEEIGVNRLFYPQPFDIIATETFPDGP